MKDSPGNIVLVTPVWNDSSRLAAFGPSLASALAASPLPIDWIIADDGSSADDVAKLRPLVDLFARIHARTSLHLAEAHRGKGGVIRETWSLAPHADWLAFVDADGSVGAEDMLHLIELAVSSGTSVLGIRKKTAETTLVESPLRAIAHRSYLLIARQLLHLRCEDPQCGAKVLRGEDFRRIAHKLEEVGLAFDSEMLAALLRDGSSWREIPVNWVQKPGGKVNPFHDGLKMLRALLRIRTRLG